MILLTYPGRVFAKSDSGDFIPHVGIDRITKFLIEWKRKFSRITEHIELKKDDFNISPSRYMHAGDAESNRLLAEILGELDLVETEARETDNASRKILEKIVI